MKRSEATWTSLVELRALALKNLLTPSDTSPSQQADVISAASFKPNARHVLSVRCDGEAMLTASNGEFEDFGMDMKGIPGNSIGVSCQGKRYTVMRRAKTHLFIWNAPSQLDLRNKSDVVFKVTAASGESKKLRQSMVTLSADDRLERPLDDSSQMPSAGNGVGSPPDESSKALSVDDDMGAVAAVFIVACVLVAGVAAAAYKNRSSPKNASSYIQMVEPGRMN